MKLYHMLLFILMSLMSLGGCSKDEASVTPELVLSVAQLEVSQTGETKTIHLKSNVNWTIESSEEWCSIVPASGSAGTNAIMLTVSENSTYEVRTSSIKVTAGDMSKTLELTQNENYLLALEQSAFDVSAQGGTVNVGMQLSNDFEITIDVDWIVRNDLKSLADSTISFDVDANSSFLSRVGHISFTLNDITAKAVINQVGAELFIPADKNGVESEALTLASKMVAGWNIGNSMEVPGGEIGWGNPIVSKVLIDGVKAAGFNAVRIPCAWDSYIVDQETYKISDSWFARVKEVVDYCYTNDMYAILNIHWDGGWLENNPTYDKQDQVNEKQYALWQQIAVFFRDYDERLLFAGTNEVHVEGVYSDPTNEYLSVQQSFNQTFVDAVRATGGKNAYRNLIVQTFNTNILYGVKYHKMPTDMVEDRLWVEVHYYDPWDFCGQESDYTPQWGEAYTDVSDWGQEDWLEEQFGAMKTHFYDKGVPVILGEYGAMLRAELKSEALEKHLASRNYYLKTVTRTAKMNGMVPFIWDNGGTGNNGFGLFNRSTGEVVHTEAVAAIIEGANN
ncbi:cellulase family glycosylhydrolase [Saccharicrinis fermentans]|uniref:cellulase family glycosylhydrolase n=1 Tax=Saccharicrinis fermentans TaxID=982 RepID=UPI000488D6C9|nr:cellulase family glycosylhydrolase [Saccharicrinis fermentans]